MAANVAASNFLAAAKEVRGRMFWRPKDHPDYYETRLFVSVLDGTSDSGEIRLTATTSAQPAKYGFALLLTRIRIVGLDVDPARSHFDGATKTHLRDTHWHFGPGKARSDSRDLTHRAWLYEFLKEANIQYDHLRYTAPPYLPEQLGLL